MLTWIKLNKYRVLRNLVFWIAYLILFMAMERTLMPLPVMLVWLAVEVTAFGLPAYFHNDYVVPQFLLKRKYVAYVLITLGLYFLTLYWAMLLHKFYYVIYPERLPQDISGLSNPFNQFVEALFIFVAFALSHQTVRSFRLRRQLALLEKEKVQVELDNLRSQINPHFLFNALNTIYGLSKANDSKASESILLLSDILRYVIYECNEAFVPLPRELEFVQKVVEFSTTRVGDFIEVRSDLPTNSTDGLIPPMLLIPLIENCFKHANAAHGARAWIELKIFVENGVLVARLANSHYPTELASQSETHSGVGLFNVRRRLNMLPESLNPKLRVRETKGRYEVNLEIEIKQHNE